VIIMWKDEIKKYANKPALKELHSAILQFVETDDVNSEPDYIDAFHETLERELYKILSMIETKLN